MKFIVKKEQIADKLSMIGYFVPTSSTIPILSSILFEIEKDKLNLIATDLDICGKIKCKLEKGPNEGKIVIHKKIISIIKEFPNADITFEKEKGDFIKINCLKSNYIIPCFNAEEFNILKPEEKIIEKVSIEQKLLLNILKYVSYAALKDSSKRNLNGVLFKFEGKEIEIVATDAHRLALYKIENKESVKTKFEYIIPLKTINELMKILKDDEEKNIDINLYDNLIEFKTDEIEIVSRIIDENYPNYKQVIPKDFIAKAEINKEEFLSAIKRVILISSEKSKTVNLKFENEKLLINSSVQDEGEATEEIEIKYDGEPIDVSYNAFYLIDALKAIEDEKVELKLVSSINPGLLKIPEKENFLYIIMPIRK